MVAIFYEKTHIAKFLIAQNAKLNVRDNHSMSTLGYGIYKNNTELCQLMLAKGARIVSKAASLYTVIHRRNVDIARLLLGNGEDVEMINYVSRSTTPFYEAIMETQPKMIELLMQYGGGRKYKMSMQQLIMDSRDLRHFQRVIRILLRYKINLKPANMNDMILCCTYGRPDLASVLVREGFNVFDMKSVPEFLITANDHKLIVLCGEFFVFFFKYYKL